MIHVIVIAHYYHLSYETMPGYALFLSWKRNLAQLWRLQILFIILAEACLLHCHVFISLLLPCAKHTFALTKLWKFCKALLSLIKALIHRVWQPHVEAACIWPSRVLLLSVPHLTLRGLSWGSAFMTPSPKVSRVLSSAHSSKNVN